MSSDTSGGALFHNSIYPMQWINSRDVFVVFVCLLLSRITLGCSRAPAPSPPLLTPPFQTGASYYEHEQVLGSINGNIKNNSSSVIEMAPLDEFFIYAHLLRRGWVSLNHCTGCVSRPEIYRSFTVGVGQTVPVDIREVAANYMLHLIPHSSFSAYKIGAHYQLQTKEKDNEKLYVMYSNEFQIGDSPIVPSFVQIMNLEFSIPLIKVSNESSGSVWIRPVCSSPTRSEEAGAIPRPGEYPHSTLQRRTSWGTWEVIKAERSNCVAEIAPIEILPQTVQTVVLWRGFDIDWETLEPGWYRWHVVYFLEGPETEFSVDYHWFTEEFQVDE